MPFGKYHDQRIMQGEIITVFHSYTNVLGNTVVLGPRLVQPTSGLSIKMLHFLTISE